MQSTYQPRKLREEPQVAIELDHVIVSARHQVVSAKRLADLLGVRWAESGAYVVRAMQICGVRSTR